jgi:cbb3-type cytochrome oxidase maturation protein
MSVLLVLIPIALGLGLCGLAAFLGATRSGQFDDLETPALRALIDESERKNDE